MRILVKRNVVPEINRPARLRAQLIVYLPTGPVIYEGTVEELEDGNLDLEVPMDVAPPAGTGVQLDIFHEDGTFEILEGVTEPPKLDGTFDILIL